MKIDKLNIGNRAIINLNTEGIFKITDLKNYSIEYIARINGIGKVALKIIANACAANNVIMHTKYSKMVDDYLDALQSEQLAIAKQMRAFVHKTIPNCIEGFNYKMPSYTYKGKPLFYFALYKQHIGVYAMPNTHQLFTKHLAMYKQGKGSVQFPLDTTIPWQVLQNMILHRYHAILHNK
jgi:uncharacterized protein YdhG (YjbR/CyaY superfamily)